MPVHFTRNIILIITVCCTVPVYCIIMLCIQHRAIFIVFLFLALFHSVWKTNCDDDTLVTHCFLQSGGPAPSPLGQMPPSDGMGPGGPMPPGFFPVSAVRVCILLSSYLVRGICLFTGLSPRISDLLFLTSANSWLFWVSYSAGFCAHPFSSSTSTTSLISCFNYILYSIPLSGLAQSLFFSFHLFWNKQPSH